MTILVRRRYPASACNALLKLTWQLLRKDHFLRCALEDVLGCDCLANITRESRMLRRCLRIAICTGVGVGSPVGLTAHAQVTAPGQLTPQDLRPPAATGEQTAMLPGASVAAPPTGDRSMTVL